MRSAVRSITPVLTCLLLVGILLLATIAGAQTFTATADGDWNNPATWGRSGSATCHTNIPCMTDTYSAGPANGDTVSLAGYNVTCSISGETCSVGNSPSANLSACTIAGGASLIDTTGGSLTLGNGATFIYAGPVCLAFGNQNIQQGARIFHDSSWASGPTNYSFVDSASGSSASTWTFGQSGGTRVFWQGDSYYSPNSCRLSGQGCSANCSTPGVSACKSGPLGGSTSGESGKVIAYNLTLANVGTNGNAWVSYLVNSQNIVFSGLVMYNSGQLNLRTGGNKSITIDRSYLTATSASVNCIQFPNGTSGTGGIVISNSYLECPIGLATGAYTSYKWINVVCKTSWNAGSQYTAGVSNLRPCLQGGTDSASHDQVLYYIDPWNSTNTEQSAAKGNIDPVALTNSVVWGNSNTVNNTHVHRMSHGWAGLVNGPWVQAYNVAGTLGVVNATAANEQAQYGEPSGGNPAAGSAFNLSAFGNIDVCGSNGRSSMGQLTLALNLDTTANVAADSVNFYQNTSCASQPTLTFAAPNNNGYITAESNNLMPNMVNANANIFFRNDGLGVGSVPEISASSVKQNFVNAPPFHNLNYNAVYNTRTAEAASAPCGTYANTCAWVTNPPQATTEIIVPATNPAFVDAGRSLPMFSEYLDASGLYPYANYQSAQTIDLGVSTCTTNYRGAWSSSTSYNPCDIVYVDGTVPGYSGVYNGRRSYWICKVAHTAGATNQPITGFDSANIYLGPAQVWEDAWLSMWMKPNVLAATAFGGASCTNPQFCNDGSLPSLYNSSTIYPVGLLNLWLRQGFTNMDPRLWGARQGTAGCSRDGGNTFVECGAMPQPSVRHIPPAAAVN